MINNNIINAKKVGKNIKYDINLAILKTVKSHNSNIHSIPKYSPEYEFPHNTKEISKEFENKIIKSEIHEKKKNIWYY